MKSGFSVQELLAIISAFFKALENIIRTIRGKDDGDEA